MSYPTSTVFLTFTSGWEVVRVHPALNWTEKYTNEFDTNKEEMRKNFAQWSTDDFSFTKATGEKTTGRDAAVEAAWGVYAPFAAHMHEPLWCVAWETDNGYKMVGQATMFADLPVPGGPKAMADMTGKKWDLATPGMFRFEYVKDAEGVDGLKLKSQEVFADSGPTFMEMLKRGMIKPEQLMG